MRRVSKQVIKINTANYFKVVKSIGENNLPEMLLAAHELIAKKTMQGKNWNLYQKDSEFREMCETVFSKMEEFRNANINNQMKGNSLNGISKDMSKANENNFSDISKEVQFIERFLEFHEKIVYKKTLDIFIDDLQAAIEKKQITKKSPVASEIKFIQNICVETFNTMKASTHFLIHPSNRKQLKAIMVKYENAHPDNDITYLNSKKQSKDLQGLNGFNSSTEDELSRVDGDSDDKNYFEYEAIAEKYIAKPEPINIMPSEEFVKIKFNTLGFKDKWLDFIGDPSPGFTATVTGRPKFGKSFLCVEFAGYLARNHGTVLYVAKEEKLDKTLQDKLKEKAVAHPNLTVSDALPNDLKPYQFIFLDSVTKLKLSPQDLEALKANNKGKAFIEVLQVNKKGQSRGSNEYQHDVDVIIEVPEWGKAKQYGRFNQGGEMDIFENSNVLQELNKEKL